MKNNLIILIVIGSFFSSLYLHAQVLFPYYNDLKGLNPQDVVVAQPSYPGLSFTPDGIRLTDDTRSISGAVILNNLSFTSANGLTVSFDYDMLGGRTVGGNYGDGLSFFLYDATAPANDDLLGGLGARIGYTFDRRSGTRKRGLNKAYLGIALDVYGNFKAKVEGLPALPLANNAFSDYGNHITIRGAMRHEAIGLDENGGTASSISTDPIVYDDPRFAGYPVLYTRGTRGQVNASGILGAYLDLAHNSSTQVTYVPITQEASVNFPLRNEIKNPAPNDSRYRRIIINLAPADPNLGGGIYITVRMQVGNDLVTLIQEFHYKEQFYYLENANIAGIPDRIKLLRATIPPLFKMGFMGVTGYGTQDQYIRNLVVDIAYKPNFANDYVNFCYGSGSVVFSPFENDFIYDGPIYAPPTLTSGPDHIDYSSFRFIEVNGAGYFDSVLGTTSGNVITYDNPDQGVWVYDKIIGSLTFTPNAEFKGKAFVYYDAKGTASEGGPFDQEIYRSAPTRAEVSVFDCGGHINPNLPFKVENN